MSRVRFRERFAAFMAIVVLIVFLAVLGAYMGWDLPLLGRATRALGM